MTAQQDLALGQRCRSRERAIRLQVRILEAFMDFSPPAATVFREIGGLSSMIDRLKVEVQAAPVASPTGADASAEAMQIDVAGSSSAAAAGSPAGAALLALVPALAAAEFPFVLLSATTAPHGDAPIRTLCR